jgi:hypothetical protein
MATLKKLTEIAIPDAVNFEQDQFLDEIIQTIKSNPEWNANYDGELTQNATFMLLNMYSFMFSKNAKAFNRQLQELFYHKANSPFSIVEGLNRLKISLAQNKAAAIQVTGTVQNNQFLESDLSIAASTSLNAIDLNGQPTIVEFISIDPATGKPDYINPVAMALTVSNRQRFDLTAYSGTTVVRQIALNSTLRENFIVEIEDKDVIDNSIRIYYNTTTELPETNTFVIPKINTSDTRFLGGTPHFIAQFDDTGKPIIYFGNEIFGGAFAEPQNGVLTIYYRVGGGKATNISQNAIAQNLIVENNSRALSINFTNNFEGGGGADRENVYEAQTFAPLRYGRTKQIVNDQDALNELAAQVVKHKVDSPRYSETLNTIQLLHAHHFIVPSRQLTSFVMPDVSDTDTSSSYSVKFLNALNQYMNADGIHDGAETELVSNFVEPSILNPTYSFVAGLGKKNALNRTLSLTAYDYLDNAIDTVSFFNTNYAGTNNSPDVYTDKAFIKTSAFGTVNVTTANNKLKLRYDKINTITITLNVGIYTPITLRDEIVSKMQLSGLGYFIINANNIVVISDNDTKVKFISAITGENSKIEIDKITGSVYSGIGLTNYQFAYATPNNGRIFTQNTNLNYTTSEVSVEININNFEDSTENKLSKVDDTWYAITTWAQDPDTASGTTFEKQITQEDNIKLEKLQLGTQVILKAVNSAGFYIDKIAFESIQDSATNAASPYQVAEANDDAGFIPANAGTYVFGALTSSNFDYQNSKLKIKLANGQLTNYPATTQTGINLNTYPLSDYTVDNNVLTAPYELASATMPGALPATVTYTGTLAHPYVKKSSLKFYYYDDSAATFNLICETDDNGFIIDSLSSPFTPTELKVKLTSTHKINYTTGEYEFSLDFGASFPPGVDANDRIRAAYVYKTGNGDNITFQIDTPSAVPISEAYSTSTGDLFTQLSAMLQFGVAKASTGFEVVSKHSGVVYPPVAITKSACSITNGSAIINVSSTTDLNIDMPVTGTGIPANSYIVSKTVNTVTINNTATATSGSVTLTFNQAAYTFTQIADAWVFALVEETGNALLSNYFTTTANNQVVLSSQQTYTDSTIDIVNITNIFNPVSVSGTVGLPYSHTTLVENIHHWEVVFTRRTYSYITATYSPNPYFPEREALSFLLQLNATNKRLLGFENLIKRVDFVPVKVVANLYANQGVSTLYLKAQTEDIIQSKFSHTNTIYEQNIGTGFSVARLNSEIGNTTNNAGVSYATVITPSSDIVDTTDTKNRYYFVMPTEIISKLKEQEATYPNIVGVSALYEPTISVRTI